MKYSEVIDLKQSYSAQLEKTWIESLLIQTSGNVSEAARKAEMDRGNFSRLATKRGVSAKEFRR